jgi:zinc transport system substrate-binding protein
MHRFNGLDQKFMECAGQKILAMTLLLSLVAMAGCDSKQGSVAKKDANVLQQRIAVTNYPLYCIASAICRDRSGPVKEVIYVGPPKESDPHPWVPSTDQIRELQNVDLVICNGPGAVFANWMDKVTIDENKLCKTTDGMKLTEFVLVEDYQLVHSHGPEGEHSHTWVVPQSWLSPRIARKQAKLCFDRLVKVYGESPKLDNGFAELQKQFDELESTCEKLRGEFPGLVIASSTPDIEYLTRELGWNNRYLQWTEPREIGEAEKELAAMRDRFTKEDAAAPKDEKLFLWSGGELQQLSGFVDSQWKASTNIDLVDVPLADSPDPNGYFERMTNNLKRIGDSLE